MFSAFIHSKSVFANVFRNYGNILDKKNYKLKLEFTVKVVQYLTPVSLGSEGKRVTWTPGVTGHLNAHSSRQKANSAFPTAGFLSTPTETAAHSSIFLHSDSEWPPRAPGHACDLSGYLSAINHRDPSLFKVSQDDFLQGRMHYFMSMRITTTHVST